MALSRRSPFSSFLLPPHKQPLIRTPPISRTLNLIPAIPNESSLILPIPLANKPFFPHQTIRCVAGAGSFAEPVGSCSPFTSISSVFVKGLSQSVSEGCLRKVFSEFGEVSNVKIIANKKTRESLGYGYVWFTREECAKLAVERMNGKFFDGRFILVKLGQPGLSSRRRSDSNFSFVKAKRI